MKSQEQRRSADRREPFGFLPVVDPVSNRPFGHIVDISLRGVMVITERELHKDETLDLRVPRQPGLASVDLTCTVVWTKPTASEGYSIAGLLFAQELSRAEEIVLLAVIQRACL